MWPFKLPPKHPTTLATCSSMKLDAFELSPQPQHSKSTLAMCAKPSASSMVGLVSLVHLVDRLPSVSSPLPLPSAPPSSSTKPELPSPLPSPVPPPASLQAPSDRQSKARRRCCRRRRSRMRSSAFRAPEGPSGCETARFEKRPQQCESVGAKIRIFTGASARKTIQPTRRPRAS